MDANCFTMSIFYALVELQKRAKNLQIECQEMYCQKIINEETYNRLKESCDKVRRDSFGARHLLNKSPRNWALKKVYELGLLIKQVEFEVDIYKKNSAEPVICQENEEKDALSKIEGLNVDSYENQVLLALEGHAKTLVELRKTGHKLAFENKMAEDCSDHIWTIRQRMERIEDELRCESREYIFCQFKVLFKELYALRQRFVKN